MPPALADVALIDGPTAAAAVGCALSAWHALVASGDAPPPAVRQHRFTRWRIADVRAFIAKLVDNANPARGAELVAQARKAGLASAARRAKVTAIPKDVS